MTSHDPTPRAEPIGYIDAPDGVRYSATGASAGEIAAKINQQVLDKYGEIPRSWLGVCADLVLPDGLESES